MYILLTISTRVFWFQINYDFFLFYLTISICNDYKYLSSSVVMDASALCHKATFALGSTSAQRSWDVLVTQYECGDTMAGPSNCLQYFIGASGTVARYILIILIVSQLDFTNISLIAYFVTVFQLQLSDNSNGTRSNRYINKVALVVLCVSNSMTESLNVFLLVIYFHIQLNSS